MNFKILFVSAFISLGTQAGMVQFSVGLSPAGSFDANSKNFQGFVVKEGETYKADELVVDVSDLKTGIELRDEHMQKKYLESEKFPKIFLRDAKGSAGSFSGNLEAHGVSKPIFGTYEVSGEILKAKFSVKMSDFSIPKAKYMGVGAKDEISVESQIPIKLP